MVKRKVRKGRDRLVKSINAKLRSLEHKQERNKMKKRNRGKGMRIVNEGAINKQENAFSRFASRAKGMVRK